MRRWRSGLANSATGCVGAGSSHISGALRPVPRWSTSTMSRRLAVRAISRDTGAASSIALCPGPPARKNTGSGCLRRATAGSTATCSAIEGPSGRAGSSGRASVPQRAGVSSPGRRQGDSQPPPGPVGCAAGAGVEGAGEGAADAAAAGEGAGAAAWAAAGTASATAASRARVAPACRRRVRVAREVMAPILAAARAAPDRRCGQSRPWCGGRPGSAHERRRPRRARPLRQAQDRPQGRSCVQAQPHTTGLRAESQRS